MKRLTALRRTQMAVACPWLFSALLSVALQDTPGAQAPAAAPRGADPSQDAQRYGSPMALPAGTSQEETWPAATAEGWAQPCLIPWQRSFEDATRVARATGAPILVCVNMDGEIASEHFAGVRYRDPATAQALERYVCVVASVYRHTPRDHDEQGQRVVCPRFGTVTCGEHIACEVELYAKYFEGRRISPRHIMLDLQGTKSYDVYYSWDVATVFTAFAKGVEDWPPPTPRPRDGWTLADRVASGDAADRARLERDYLAGDSAQRMAILRAVLAERSVPQDDVLRLAIFGLDLECAHLARAALAESESEGAIDVIAEALKVPLEPQEREALVAAAERLAEAHPRARTLVALHRGLSMDSSRIRAAEALDTSASAAEYAANVLQHAQAAEARPEDPALKLALAESLLARAAEEPHDARWTRVWLRDARANAEAARRAAGGWHADATLAAILDLAGEEAEARQLAVAAVEGGMWDSEQSAGTATDLVEARVLALFAQARQLAIREAYKQREKWPPEWLADVNAAYVKLAAHPLVAEENLLSFYDFLYWVGGTRRARAVLDEALVKFPDSAVLHDRLRAHVLWDQGPTQLLDEYDDRLRAPEHSRQLTWFAGYASLVAAEHLRRRNDLDGARAAYARGIELYERNLADVPEGRDSCDHFIALALAGLARTSLEQGDLAAATDELLASFERRAASAGTMDGLDITPGMTALMLKARLADAGRAELSTRLAAAMAAMDPVLFEEPDFARQRGGTW